MAGTTLMSRQEKPKVGVDIETVHACLGNRSSNLVKQREMSSLH